MKKINFFGCSFTEGGGLDNIDYYNFINKTNLYFRKDNTVEGGEHNKKIKEQLKTFRNKNRFSKLVSEKLNISNENFAISINSNDNILNKLFSVLENNENEIYVVCLSIFTRVYWYYQKTNKQYNLNSFDNFNWLPFNNENNMIDLFETYKMYISNIFDADIEKQKLVRQCKLFDNFAKTKNSKIFWMSWEEFPELKNVVENYILFDGMAMCEYVKNNKLQIFEHSNGICNDMHVSTIGNKIIGEIIAEYIKSKL